MAMVWPLKFRRGPFSLGKASRPIGAVSCLWIGFISIAFCLPTVNPVTSQTLNYTGVAVGIVGAGALGSWGFWARKWFTGRCRNHCRVCIQQLDFLTEQIAQRPGSSAGGSNSESGLHAYPLERSDSSRPIRTMGKGGLDKYVSPILVSSPCPDSVCLLFAEADFHLPH